MLSARRAGAAKVPRWRITRVAPVAGFRRPAWRAGVQQNWKGVASYATVGLEFGLSLLVGLFAGRWLDQKLDTAHWFTFIGGGFGMAAGYRAIYRAAKAANREAEREEAEERARRQRYHDDHSKR